MNAFSVIYSTVHMLCSVVSTSAIDRGLAGSGCPISIGIDVVWIQERGRHKDTFLCTGLALAVCKALYIQSLRHHGLDRLFRLSGHW
jgi:hypothetical protein